MCPKSVESRGGGLRKSLCRGVGAGRTGGVWRELEMGGDKQDTPA